MVPVEISVTEASRNFADCVNRARYQGAHFALVKNGVAVARIVPAARKTLNGEALANALPEALQAAKLGHSQATAWLHDLEEARRSQRPQAAKWPS